MQDDPEAIAARLSTQDQDICLALCGNAWVGSNITPGLARMNGLELMHLDVLKNQRGEVTHCKAKPTPLGLAVRESLQNKSGTSTP